jgi:ornithine--oxo-acid transaminase
MPVSGIAANRDVLDVIKAGQHGSTFGGNPLASVVAMAAIDVLEEEKLVENSANMGNYFMGELRKLVGGKIDLVRGKGLLVGIRIAEKHGKAKPFIKALKAEGILAKDTHEKIIRFAPPLVISKEEIDWAMERIRKVFA